jgi:branched-chain amino acid aminotransferase
MSPAISALHYGQAIFEGMKAYRLPDGSISIFRADKNFARFNKSASRMAMVTVPEDVFMQGIAALINLDRDWVPTAANNSLYIRPALFAMDAKLGVKASADYKFVVLTSPAGPYFNKPLRVKIETHYSRGADGGVGAAKTAGNYAMSMLPTAAAQSEGYDQLIWTDAKEHLYVEESGAANLMFVMDNKIVTPEIRETILDGVTRDTVLHIAKNLGYGIEERRVSVKEVLEKIATGELTEAFAVGTAATITQIAEIGFEDTIHTLNDPTNRPVSAAITKKVNDIRYGLVPDEFGWNWII